MADVRCPMCGEHNSAELEICQFCGARLKPLLAPTPGNLQPVNKNIEPVKQDAGEFENGTPVGEEPARPGNDVSGNISPDQEPIIPSWLGTLREGLDSTEGKPVEDESPDQDLPGRFAPSGGEISSTGLPDRLSGLGKDISEKKEEIPDWLTGLRDEKTGISGPKPEENLEPQPMVTGSLSGTNTADWMARLGGESQPVDKPEEGAVPSETTPQEDQLGEETSIDWLDSLKSKPASSDSPGQPFAMRAEEKSGLLSHLSDSEEENKPESGEGEKTSNLPVQQDEKVIDSEPPALGEEAAAASSSLPDWLSSLKSEPETPETASREGLTENQSDLNAQTDAGFAAPTPPTGSETPSSSATPNEIPDWLSQLKADTDEAGKQTADNGQLEEADTPTTKKEDAGPLPDWLKGIKSSPVPSDRTPPLVANGEGAAVVENKDTPFSMDLPDWLSKLKPDKTAEIAPEAKPDTSTPDNLEVSELPSWVQAMRPVESVVDKATETPQEKTQTAEQSGPLAGLKGVLPAGPGLGPLRKPPAYSTLLQVTEGQQRYATAFEQLISSETQPQAARRTFLASSQLWRWLISALLILAVIIPLATGITVTPAGRLRPPEMLNTFTSIASLPSNAPVLIIFDYDPALSGELEAAAAPLMDHLLLQGPRLAMISTNPTGPVLAEKLLHDTSASLLVAGQQYVNLGFLAGGPSGVQYFAASPLEAAPFTMDGQQAWQLPPLQGIRKLSDFSAIIVLTDNADSGRIWIEQTGSTIGNTPLLMVISAQAEPLILPYYDSGQIKGMVTGLAGGEAYGQTLNHPDALSTQAKRYWNSFSAGTLVAEILIAVGALLSAMAGWRARRDRAGEGV